MTTEIEIQVGLKSGMADPEGGNVKKALDLLANGKAVDYEGATAVQFTNVGEAAGSFIEKEIKGGKFKNKKQR